MSSGVAGSHRSDSLSLPPLSRSVIIRFGFAEQPSESDGGTIVSLLCGAHASPSTPAAAAKLVAPLEHARCTLGKCVCDAPTTPCGLVTFYVARDVIKPAGAMSVLPSAIYNGLLANSPGRATFLGLPMPQVVELAGTIDASRHANLANRS